MSSSSSTSSPFQFTDGLPLFLAGVYAAHVIFREAESERSLAVPKILSKTHGYGFLSKYLINTVNVVFFGPVRFLGRIFRETLVRINGFGLSRIKGSNITDNDGIEIIQTDIEEPMSPGGSNSHKKKIVPKKSDTFLEDRYKISRNGFLPSAPPVQSVGTVIPKSMGILNKNNSKRFAKEIIPIYEMCAEKMRDEVFASRFDENVQASSSSFTNGRVQAEKMSVTGDQGKIRAPQSPITRKSTSAVVTSRTPASVLLSEFNRNVVVASKKFYDSTHSDLSLDVEAFSNSGEADGYWNGGSSVYFLVVWLSLFHLSI